MSANNDRVNLNRSDIPFSLLKSGYYIELLGNSKVLIEGKYTILEYKDDFLKLKAGRQPIEIFGKDLTLSNVRNDGCHVLGTISQIQFE